MQATDYPVQHFEMMARLAARCRESGAQILEHVYHYNAFGSWWLNFEFRGGLYRIVLDVRESELTLERAPDPRRQNFAVVASRRSGRAEAEVLIGGLLDSLAGGKV